MKISPIKKNFFLVFINNVWKPTNSSKNLNFVKFKLPWWWQDVWNLHCGVNLAKFYYMKKSQR